MANYLFIFILVLTQACWGPSPEAIKNKTQVVDSMVEALQKQHPDQPGLSPRELSQLMKDSSSTTYLIDVRDPREREISQLPNSLSKEEFQTLSPDKKDLVVTYDIFGYRALEVVKELKEDGHENVLYLQGGVLAWAHAGLEFIDPQGEQTNRVHVSNEAWSLLPDEYEAVDE